MKLRRFVAAATVATTMFVATPAADARQIPAPEPLNQVLREITKVAGWDAQNIILIPAGLSALTSSLNILGLILEGAQARSK